MMMGIDTTQHAVHMGIPGVIFAVRQQRPVLVRQGAPADTEALMSMYRRLSERSIRLRYGAPRYGISDAALQAEMAQAVGAAPGGQISLIGSVGEDGVQSLVALLQLVPLPHDPGTAEVAIVVRDDYQRQGVGRALCRPRALCRRIGELARAQGVRRLQIDMLAENRPVLRLIQSMGARYTSETRRGETRVIIVLE